MKRYIISSVVNDRSKYPEVKPRKPATKRVTADDIRLIFEQGLAQSKLAGHPVTFYNLSKSRYTIQDNLRGWEIMYSLDGVKYRNDNSHPTIVFSTLSELTDEMVADSINSDVDNLMLIADSDINMLEARLSKNKKECIKAINYCLSKYDCEGVYSPYHFDHADVHRGWILVDINFTSIAGFPVRDDYVESNGKRYFVGGLYLDGNPVCWDFNKSYKDNLDTLEAAFKQATNRVKDALGIISQEDELELFEQNYTRALDRFVKYSRIPVYISNIEVSRKDGDLYLTFDVSAYDGKIDMTLEFSKAELSSMQLEDKLKSLLRSYKRKLGI